MSFDEIFDLTAGVYINFYNICYIIRESKSAIPAQKKKNETQTHRSKPIRCYSNTQLKNIFST